MSFESEQIFLGQNGFIIGQLAVLPLAAEFARDSDASAGDDALEPNGGQQEDGSTSDDQPTTEAGGAGGHDSGNPDDPPRSDSGDEFERPERNFGEDLAPSPDVFEAHTRAYNLAKVLQMDMYDVVSNAINELSSDILNAHVAGIEIPYVVSARRTGVVSRSVSIGTDHLHRFNIHPTYDIAATLSHLAQMHQSRERGEVIIGSAYRSDGSKVERGINFGVFCLEDVQPVSTLDTHAEQNPQSFDPEYRAVSLSFAHLPTEDSPETFYAVIPDVDVSESGTESGDEFERFLEAIDATSDSVFRGIDDVEDINLQERAFLTRGLLHIALRGTLAHNDVLLDRIDSALEAQVLPFTVADLIQLTHAQLEAHPGLQFTRREQED